MNTKPITSKKTSLPQPVMEQLQYLTTQRAVAALFLSRIIGSTHPCVVVLLNNESNATEWRKQKWVRNAFQNHEVTFLILGKGDVAAHTKNGTLFVEYHCTAEKAMYIAEDRALALPPFAESKKRSKQLKKHFNREIDLLTTQINTAKNTEGYVTVFSVYTTLYNQYFLYFEWLLFGTVYNGDDLHSRLHRLCVFIPAFQKAFVKTSAKTYFLLEALATAVEAEQDDLSSLDIDYLPSITANAAVFHAFAEELFKQLKAAAKRERRPLQATTAKQYDCPKALHLVTKHQQVEAIYEYEKRLLPGTNEEKKEIRYWLVIGEGIASQQLANWHEGIKQITKDTVEVVPIVHSRSWIQKRLFENQLFFQKVMQVELLIYDREPNLPTIHWQVPYTFCSPDLAFYRSGCLALQETIKLLRTADATLAHEGLGFLYSSLIARSCQVLIYAKLSYYPNQLPIAILWRLAELASEQTIQLRFLHTKLTVNLINFINHHNNIYKRNQKVTPNDLTLLDTLTTELINQLNQE
ncbi:hypothetical protein [Flavobacterium lacus]|uniref:Uncharacterized protein n=1 Tax=Flavobacterium lacus TaxID=1353778 RepID=A0A328WKN1_9FLAO|nr:hypothetical protein [Flavobacterium lacus]RAR46811.1 hypothetical protein B0I10_11427 [Flavobacterium lacus]